MLASHFDCQRDLDIAVGLSTSGMGFGVLALPPLIRIMIDAYGWHGAMLLCGGLVLNVCVFAVLGGPPKRENDEVIRSLSMCSVAYLRTDNDRPTFDGNIISMSMTSVYIMKDTDVGRTVGDMTDRTRMKNSACVTKDIASDGNVANVTKDTTSTGNAAHVASRTAESAHAGLTGPHKTMWKKFPQLNVIRSNVFLTILLSEILSNMTISSVLTTLPDFAHCNGHSLFRASLLLSIYGTTATLGRLYLSLFSATIRKFKSNKRVTIAATNLITMFSVICIGFTGKNYYLISLWVGLFGIATGAKGTFISCFVIKLLGPKNTITAVGFVGLSCGIGQFGGPPLAGVLFSVTGWYPVVYCFGAVTSFLASSCVVVIIVRHSRDRKSKRFKDSELTKKNVENGSLL
jgi:MFS family permease